MKEEDIRPKKIFDEYLRLSAEDADLCFKNSPKKNFGCPACEAENPVAFEKNGFNYKECSSCGTLYQSPRYSLESYEKFYRDSRSTKYWATTFFPSVAETRRNKIFIPRVEKIISICKKQNIKPEVVCDIGAGMGIFLEEWKKRLPQSRCIAIEPSADMAQKCRDLNLEVIEDIAENVQNRQNSFDVLTCFELLEHVYDPKKFISNLYNLVKPGGFILVTTLGVDGFDIQILWEKSNSVSPPHHINLFSKKGLETLFSSCDFSQIEIITPGKLDVDIVKNFYQENPTVLDNHRFIKQIINNDSLSEKFQNFLQDNKLSSHTWILAKKPN